MKEQYELSNQYQKYILNDFCENEKNSKIESEFVEEFDTQLGSMLSVFKDNEIFKKVDSNGNYHGNRNTNISEVFLATAIVHKTNINENLVDRYKHEIHTEIDKFNVNKMNNGLLNQRYKVCKRILGIDDE